MKWCVGLGPGDPHKPTSVRVWLTDGETLKAGGRSVQCPVHLGVSIVQWDPTCLQTLGGAPMMEPTPPQGDTLCQLRYPSPPQEGHQEPQGMEDPRPGWLW